MLLKAVADRRCYARQGITFTGGSGPIQVEHKVSKLLRTDLTRDHLLDPSPASDFVGTWRGFRVQLYATTREAVEVLVNPALAGKFIDRDTPARHSIGQLSPSAITFTSSNSSDFHHRKRNILRAADPDLAGNVSQATLRHVKLSPEAEGPSDLRPVATSWARTVMGQLIWGPEASNTLIPFEHTSGESEQIPFDIALYDTFTCLRRYSTTYWVRLQPFLASAPLTAEARRLRRNIATLQRHTQVLIDGAAEGTIAERLHTMNQICGISTRHTRDDIMTCYLAGLDTTKTAILAVLWHLLHPTNYEWREGLMTDPSSSGSGIATACVLEALRLSTPGSVFNGRVVQDFDVHIGSRKYRLLANTRIMPSVHAVHSSYGSDFRPDRLLSPVPIRDRPLVMPFGKGVRSCPGRSLATALTTNFVVAFLQANSDARLVNPQSAPHFNTTSSASLEVEFDKREIEPGGSHGH